MADWLAARVRASSAATALVDPESNERLTYADLDERATRRANALETLGIGAGDHVASAVEVGVPGIALVHAAARLGAVLVPLSARLTGSELETRVERADCDLLVHGEGARAAASAVESVPVVPIDECEPCERERGESSESSDASESRSNRVDWTVQTGRADRADRNGTWGKGGLDEPLVIPFTSGTTGRPKGVVLTAGNVLASAGASAARLGVLPEDRWLLALSLGSMGGLAPVYRSVLYGTALVCQRGFDPQGVLRALSTHECTGVSLVPTMLGRVLDALEAETKGGERNGSGGHDDRKEEREREGEHEREGGHERGRKREGTATTRSEGSTDRFPAGVRCVLLGGAPASRHLIERCRAHGVPVHPTYGMTETASQVATARPAEAFSHLGTVGQPLMGVDVYAVEDGESLDPGTRGELVVSGPVVTPGYYGNTGETTAAVSEHGFHTGDLGYVDDDGLVWVTGRLDDRIVTGGQTVDPEEVRGVLRDHPAVRDAAVVGLSDPEWGERIGALVVASEDDVEGLRAELEAHCRGSLAGYKLPRTMAFADALPRTESGTVDRGAVADDLRAAAED